MINRELEKKKLEELHYTSEIIFFIAMFIICLINIGMVWLVIQYCNDLSQAVPEIKACLMDEKMQTCGVVRTSKGSEVIAIPTEGVSWED